LALSSSVSQPLFGALADRVGRRPVMAAGIAVSASLLSLIVVAPSIWALLGLVFIGGLGSAALHPAGSSLARSAGRDKPALAVGLFSAGGTAGIALGPVIVLALIATFGGDATPWLLIPGVLLGLALAILVPTELDPPVGARRLLRARLLDPRLIAGPVGTLSLSEIFSRLAHVTFTGAMPLWLVSAHGLGQDDARIGWTLATFSLAAAGGGIAVVIFGAGLSRRLLVPGTTLLALPLLLLVLRLDPHAPAFFVAVALAGAMLGGSLPLKISSAQDLAPHAVATASAMLMGFAAGTAGVLYIGIGLLQETVGLQTAMGIGFLGLIPSAALAFGVLSKPQDQLATPADVTSVTERPAVLAAALGDRCLCLTCPCAGACACPVG
ncbi:MAG TPA: MFS transporter, partial [Chloroflexota bacterium]|nr:MFS transporter [Chloroflexota bacterium]